MSLRRDKTRRNDVTKEQWGSRRRVETRRYDVPESIDRSRRRDEAKRDGVPVSAPNTKGSRPDEARRRESCADEKPRERRVSVYESCADEDDNDNRWKRRWQPSTRGSRRGSTEYNSCADGNDDDADIDYADESYLTLAATATSIRALGYRVKSANHDDVSPSLHVSDGDSHRMDAPKLETARLGAEADEDAARALSRAEEGAAAAAAVARSQAEGEAAAASAAVARSQAEADARLTAAHDAHLQADTAAAAAAGSYTRSR
jgi:hypothetical protein